MVQSYEAQEDVLFAQQVKQVEEWFKASSEFISLPLASLEHSRRVVDTDLSRDV